MFCCHAKINCATAPAVARTEKLVLSMALDLATAIDLSFLIFALFVVLWIVAIICTRQPLKDIQTTVERTPSRVLRSDTARHHLHEDKNPVKLL